MIRRALVSVCGAALVMSAVAAGEQASATPSTSRPATAPLSDLFDTASMTTLSGVLYVMKVPNASPHVYLIMEVGGTPGKGERWAVEGDAVTVLARHGWQRDVRRTLSPGQMLSVTVYRPKRGTSAERTVPASETDLLQLAKAGRLAHGIDVTLANGSKLWFGARE